MEDPYGGGFGVEVVLRDYLAASALATDLVLTVAGHSVEDRLVDPDQLSALLHEHGLEHGPVEGTDVEEARMLRDEVLALFACDTDEQVIAAASAVLALCPHRLRAGADHTTAPGGDWRLVPLEGVSTVGQVRLMVGAGLLSLVRALGADRFRGCASPRCSGRFIDTSRSGRRRYCLPSICGNRVNVARYRARRSGAPAPGAP